MQKALSVVSAKTGVSSELAANGIIYQRLIRESNSVAFMDAFYICTLIMICIVPLVFFLKRVKKSDGPIAMH